MKHQILEITLTSGEKEYFTVQGSEDQVQELVRSISRTKPVADYKLVESAPRQPKQMLFG
mgnify:CR=1 FL=1